MTSPVIPATQVVIPPRTDETVPIFNQSALVPFLIPWQIKAHCLSLVVKGTFNIVPGSPVSLSSEQDPPCGDIPTTEDSLSIRYSSDFAIRKPKADLLLVGHAFASDNPTLAFVQLSLGSTHRSLAVFGDRSWNSFGLQSKPIPFARLALVWELALGGPLSDQNPVGRGFKTGVLLPNLERKDSLLTSPRDVPRPACFAPIAPLWPSRKAKLGSFGSKWLKNNWPYFPEDFDFSFFNAAPDEMQIPFPKGNETFSLLGLAPNQSAISGQLPDFSPHAFVQYTDAAGGAFVEIPLALDTLHFDTDNLKLVLLWRALLTTKDDESSDIAAFYLTSSPHAQPPSLENARLAFLQELASLPPPKAAKKTSAEPLQKKTSWPFLDAKSPAVLVPLPRRSPLPDLQSPKVDRKTALAWIAEKLPMDGRDLSGVDLSNADLRGANLEKAVLLGANLENSRLSGAKLAFASMSFANAKGASFENADLSNADLHGADLTNASFKKAKLLRADLSSTLAHKCSFTDATATQCVFANAIADHANFDKADLDKADFSQAQLEETSFQGASLKSARFYEAHGSKLRFDCACLEQARMDNCAFPNSNFSLTNAEDSVWEHAELTACVFHQAQLSKANFSRSTLDSAVLNQVVAVGCSFRKAKLRKITALKANFMQACFEGADLSNSDLRGANLFQTETWKAKTDGANLQMALVSGSKLSNPK